MRKVKTVGRHNVTFLVNYSISKARFQGQHSTQVSPESEPKVTATLLENTGNSENASSAEIRKNKPRTGEG